MNDQSRWIVGWEWRAESGAVLDLRQKQTNEKRATLSERRHLEVCGGYVFEILAGRDMWDLQEV